MSGTLQHIPRTSADTREMLRQATVPALRTFLGVPDAADGVWTRDELAGIQKPFGGVQLNNNVVGQYINVPSGRFNFGTRDFSIVLRRCPTPNPPANDTFMFMSHRLDNANRVMGKWPDAHTFRLVFTDGAGAETQIDIADSRVHEGHAVILVCDRDGNASLYYDGVLEGTASLASVAGYDIGAGNATAGGIGHHTGRPFHALAQSFEVINRALTPDEVGEIGRGGNLSGLDRGIDSSTQLPVRAYDWSAASTDGWVDGDGELVSIAGGESVSDGAESRNDCLLVRINTTNAQHRIWSSPVPLVVHKRYRIFGWYLIKNANGVDRLDIFNTVSLDTIGFLMVVGSWTYFELEFTTTSWGIGIRPRGGGSMTFPGTGVEDDDSFAIHGLQVERVGSVVRYDPEHIVGDVWYGHNGERFDAASNIVGGSPIPMAGPARITMETGDPVAEVFGVRDADGVQFMVTEAGYLLMHNTPESEDGAGLLNGQVYVDSSGFLKQVPNP